MYLLTVIFHAFDVFGRLLVVWCAFSENKYIWDIHETYIHLILKIGNKNPFQLTKAISPSHISSVQSQ